MGDVTWDWPWVTEETNKPSQLHTANLAETVFFRTSVSGILLASITQSQGARQVG